MTFYLNILSLFVFIVFSRCFSFRSLRDTFSKGGICIQRNKIDFLEHCQDDIHWFTVTITQIGLLGWTLMLLIQTGRFNKTNRYAYSLTGICTKYLINLICVFELFFKKHKDIARLVKFRLFISVVVSTFMLYHLIQMESILAGLFWRPFMVLDFIIEFIFCINMLLEVLNLPTKIV